jgi:RNA polymerase sigma factor (sigma-70 family)
MEKQHESVAWQQLKQGDTGALDYFYDTYVQSLYNYGRKITHHEALIKDCIQDLFIDIWRNRSSLPYPKSPKFYLLKSLRYKIIRQLKKEQRQLQTAHLSHDTALAHVPSYEFDLIAKQLTLEKRQQLQKGLKTLSNRQREAIVLKFYEELNYEEIAAIMGINSQSVYNLIHQSINILKKYLAVEITFFSVLQFFQVFF